MRATPRIRHGFTLIEIVTVIAMLSILLTMTGVIIQSLLRSDQTVSQQAVLEMTLLRVSQQFRDDVHSATTLGPEPDKQFSAEAMELLGPQPGSIRLKYHIDGATVIRESFEGDQLANREVFRLPDCQVQFRSEPIDAGPANADKRTRFLVLSIDRGGLAITPQQPSVRGNRQLTVVAELARDQRILMPLKPGPAQKAADADAEKP